MSIGKRVERRQVRVRVRLNGRQFDAQSLTWASRELELDPSGNSLRKMGLRVSCGGGRSCWRQSCLTTD